MQFRLLTPSYSNYKTEKGEKFGYFTGILHLSPYKTAGVGNVCPWSTVECRQFCLNYSGHGGIIEKVYKTNNVQRARIAKTRSLALDNKFFMKELSIDIEAGYIKAKKKNMIFCVRLNGTSDLNFEDLKVGSFKNIFSKYKHIQFYDYTKSYKRIVTNIVPNYYLILSFSGANKYECLSLLHKGYNVAVIFRKTFPSRLWGYDVINGDVHDVRFIDKPGVIVGLKAKGCARYSDSCAIL